MSFKWSRLRSPANMYKQRCVCKLTITHIHSHMSQLSYTGFLEVRVCFITRIGWKVSTLIVQQAVQTPPHTHTNTHTHTFSGTTRVSRYQKGKTNLDFTEVRDSEWQWHQLGHMQVCTSLQTDNHASTPPLSFFTGRMPFLQPNQQRQSTGGKLPCNSAEITCTTSWTNRSYEVGGLRWADV